MIISHELINLFFLSPLEILFNLFKFKLAALKISLCQLQVPLRLKIALADLIKLHALRVKIKSILRLEVFLNAHPEYILIDRKSHLRIDVINFFLLSFNDESHLLYAHFIIFFKILPGGDLFNQTVLILVCLILNHLEMLLEIVE